MDIPCQCKCALDCQGTECGAPATQEDLLCDTCRHGYCCGLCIDSQARLQKYWQILREKVNND